MADFLSQAWQDLQLAFERAVQWLASLQYDPRQGDVNTWLLVGGAVLLLVMVLFTSNRRRRVSKGPQFLLTNGQIVLLDELPLAAAADGGRRQAALLQAPPDAEYQLRVTVNNLNSYPVQLLEIAVRTSAGRLPVVADASAVVPPNGAVDVVADIADLPGERGTLELYLYNNKVTPRSLRLIVPVDWEPWNQRYRVRATAQRLEPTRLVASQARQRQEKAAIRRGRFNELVSNAAHGLSERTGEIRRDLRVRRERAASERRERRAAERQAVERRRGEQSDGPFSVPLAPSAGRPNDRREWQAEPPMHRDEPWDEFQVEHQDVRQVEHQDVRQVEHQDVRQVERQDVRQHERPDEHAEELQEDARHEQHDELGEPEPQQGTRPPEDLEIKDREPEPRRRLEFPDDF